MRRSFSYLPILRAKQGEFDAVRWLSPHARSRIVPLFDIPVPGHEDPVSLKAYLARSASRVRNAWGGKHVFYVDVHDLPLDWRTDDGQVPVASLFDEIYKDGLLAIPVTGVVDDRDAAYLDAVRVVVARDKRGVCVRLGVEDLEEPTRFPSELGAVLKRVGVTYSAADVLLDLRYVGDRNRDSLRSLSLDALRSVQGLGDFRNVIVVGGSVPERLRQADTGRVRREARLE